MRLELIWSNEAEVADVSVHAAIAAHRRIVRDLVNFARKCDENVSKSKDDLAVWRNEHLSAEEQSALTVVATAPICNHGDRQAKALYLAELIEADPECVSPDDLVAAFRTMATPV